VVFLPSPCLPPFGDLRSALRRGQETLAEHQVNVCGCTFAPNVIDFFFRGFRDSGYHGRDET